MNSDPEKARALLMEGMCPLCPAGPFRWVATHVSKVHGVGRFALRELAGMTRYASILSPEEHATRSDLAKISRPTGPPVGSGRGHPKTFSSAGLASQRTRWRSIPPEVRSRSAAKAAAVRNESLRPLWVEAAAVYEQERRRLGRDYGAVAATAARLGISESAVRRRLRAPR